MIAAISLMIVLRLPKHRAGWHLSGLPFGYDLIRISFVISLMPPGQWRFLTTPDTQGIQKSSWGALILDYNIHEERRLGKGKCKAGMNQLLGLVFVVVLYSGYLAINLNSGINPCRK